MEKKQEREESSQITSHSSFGVLYKEGTVWMIHCTQRVPVLIFMHRLVSLGVRNPHFKISLFTSILAAGCCGLGWAGR